MKHNCASVVIAQDIEIIKSRTPEAVRSKSEPQYFRAFDKQLVGGAPRPFDCAILSPTPTRINSRAIAKPISWAILFSCGGMTDPFIPEPTIGCLRSTIAVEIAER
jgi:hypothetical protein